MGFLTFSMLPFCFVYCFVFVEICFSVKTRLGHEWGLTKPLKAAASTSFRILSADESSEILALSPSIVTIQKTRFCHEQSHSSKNTTSETHNSESHLLGNSYQQHWLDRWFDEVEGIDSGSMNLWFNTQRPTHRC